MAKTKVKERQKIADMTLGELKEFIRQVLREELKSMCTVDEKGNLVFYSEEAYARYLELTGRKPSEVKAYWVEEGLRFRYSDDEVTPELARELDEAKKEPLVSYDQVRKDLGL